jgi:hypothetical protein
MQAVVQTKTHGRAHDQRLVERRVDDLVRVTRLEARRGLS